MHNSGCAVADSLVRDEVTMIPHHVRYGLCMEDIHIAQLLHGNVETLVLMVLSEGALHVYGIKKMLYDRSDGYFGLSEGRLYPLLRKLESRGFVCGYEAISDTGRQVREYSLTQAGRTDLNAHIKAWDIFSDKMNKVMNLQP